MPDLASLLSPALPKIGVALNAWVAAGFLLVSAAGARAQRPELDGLLPGGGPRGQTTRVEIVGRNLQGARLLIDGPGMSIVSSSVSPGGDRLTADIAAASEASFGPHDLRIATPKGVSGGGRFWVDLYPNRMVPAPMKESAPPVDLGRGEPFVYNSRISEKAARDRYVLNAMPGETWIFDCQADRIRSRMDPVIELRDERGVLLKLVQSTWESDPRFYYQFAKAGAYYLSVRDSEYNGGPNYTYRLLAGKAPLVTGVTPLGERPGAQVTLALQGANLAADTAVVTVPADARKVCWVPVSQGAALAPMHIDTVPVTRAANQLGTQSISGLPAIVDGAFTTRPEARYSIHAAANDRLLIDLLGRRIGSRIDGAISVLDSSGKEVAAVDDAPDLGKDARMEFAAPAAGDYTVVVRNVEEVTGQDCCYRLRISPILPDFDLVLETDRVEAPAAGTIVFPVTIRRVGGFDGPIGLHVEGLPAGISVHGGHCVAGRNSAELTFTVPPGTPFVATPIRIFGEATVNGKRVRHEAPARERYEHRSIDLLLSVEYSYTRPYHIWDMMLVGVTDRVEPITLSVDVVEARIAPGGTVEIPVHVLRHPGSDGEIKLDVRGLNGKVSAAAATIPARQTEGKIVLKAAPDMPPGEDDIIVQAHLGDRTALSPAIHLIGAKAAH